MSDLNEWIKERRRIREHALTLDERADTENAYPALLAAVEKVLELHKPEYLIRDGEWRPANCAVCEPWTWPCETVQAIEGAINDH